MRALRIATAALLALLLGVVPTVSSDAAEAEDAALAPNESPGLADGELLDALRSANLLDAWYAASPVVDEAAAMRVSGSAGYVALREQLLGDAAALDASRVDEIRVLNGIEDVETAISGLEELAHSLRTRMMTDPRPLKTSEFDAMDKALRQDWGLAGIPELETVVAELEAFRSRMGDEITISQALANDDKDPNVSGISVLLADLDDHRDELGVIQDRAMETTATESVIIARMEAAIPELHQSRMLASTPIDGLPLVTLDAYLSAGDHGIAGCAVDWSLIAGIGRIESIHGTLGEATVARSGAVSPRILGPLLDGGATKREAAAAIEAAEAEAAEELRLEAEEEARLAQEEEDRMRELFGSLYSIPMSELVRDAGLDADSDDEDGDSDEDSDSDEDDENEDDEEDDKPKGNGFAVIVDTDDGVMDGNPRWDRAVGPMQFIPGTWASWDTDGNGDGIADPHNLYDATASAAAYLCYLERRSGPSPWNYVLGYNASSSYVASVMRTADRLAGITLPEV